MLTFADLLEALSGTRPGWGNQEIANAVIDSREAVPGSLFIALAGEQTDGHDYVEDAFNRGAVLALVQRSDFSGSGNLKILDLKKDEVAGDLLQGLNQEAVSAPLCLLVENSLQALQEAARFWRKKLPIKVIGITGSVGKSTTKEVAAEVLLQRYRTLKSPGNFNNEIGLPLTILSLNEQHERAVLEMGFYVPGEIRFLCDLAKPQVGVITNVGTVHAERAGSLEAIARGKGELVESLPPAPEGVAILNYDDLWVREMAEKTQAQILYYGLDPAADLWADQVEGQGLDGIRFKLHFKGEVLHLRVPLIGRHSVHTALRAAAIGLVEGLTWQEIVNGLRSEITQLRLVSVRSQSGSLLLDDTYNSSPQSALAALNLLEELEGNRIAVLGDMLELGPYEAQGHEMVGARAAEVADELICLGKLSEIIARSALNAGMEEEQVKRFSTKQEIIDYLRPRLGSQDVVLIKGSRGLRMDTIVAALEFRA
jgi:UDP-N-acetylmuramoyl-tripeptide--D-alanyl-D-alanine ligase